MARSYLVVSDLHLMDIEDHADGWKAHKGRPFLFDSDFERLVHDFVDRAKPAEELVLLLNGDILDFDLVTAIPEPPPWPISRTERSRGMWPTGPKSAWKAQRMVDHHPGFMRCLAQFAAAGHLIVYVAGNHDKEVCFPEVQLVLQAALSKAASDQGLPSPRPLRFEPWFYYEPNEVYAEHGNQLDPYSSFRDPTQPMVRWWNGEDSLVLPMGNVSCRFLLNTMGTFNPHAGDFALSVINYVRHWWRHYAISRRSLIVAWMWGSILTFWTVLSMHRAVRRDDATKAEPLTTEPGVSPATRQELVTTLSRKASQIDELVALGAPPIANRLYRIARELWLDRLIMAMAMVGGTVALSLVSIPLWIQLMVPLCVFPLLYLFYEGLAQQSVYAYGSTIADRARRIAEILPCRVVALGHTHQPMVVPLARELSFVNTGTWAPVWQGDAMQPGRRNFARVRFSDGTSELVLDSWSESRLMRELEAAAEAEPAPGLALS